MDKKSEVVAVRVAGRFAEFYSPYYKEPYEDNADYRAYYNEYILPIQPVIGPCLGDGDDYLSDDLVCLAERLACDCEGSEDSTEKWIENRDTIMDAVDAVFKSGETATPVIGNLQLIITPFKRCDLPPINEDHLKVFGKYAALVRERVAAI